MEEVATMKLNTIQRPSLLPAGVCAPSASWAPCAISPVVASATPASAPQVHSAQIQAELGQRAQVRVSGAAYGFEGTNVLFVKRMTDGGSGTPPRGRPV
jgi:hypothetical protein